MCKISKTNYSDKFHTVFPIFLYVHFLNSLHISVAYPLPTYDTFLDPTLNFDADPDPTFRFYADPDTSFHFDVDPDADPAAHKSDANLLILAFRPSL